MSTQTAWRLAWSEKCRDPQWQKMRLEVMSRAGFVCEECGAAHLTLNVHHTFYESGLEPWDYPADSLRCWCEPCHERHTLIVRGLRKKLGAVPIADLARLLGYLLGLASWKYPPDDRPIRLPGPGALDGFADAWHLGPATVERAAVNDTITTEKLAALRLNRHQTTGV